MVAYTGEVGGRRSSSLSQASLVVLSWVALETTVLIRDNLEVGEKSEMRLVLHGVDTCKYNVRQRLLTFWYRGLIAL